MSSCDIENQEHVRLFRNKEFCGPYPWNSVPNIAYNYIGQQYNLFCVVYIPSNLYGALDGESEWLVSTFSMNVQRNAMTDIYDGNFTAPKKRV